MKEFNENYFKDKINSAETKSPWRNFWRGVGRTVLADATGAVAGFSKILVGSFSWEAAGGAALVGGVSASITHIITKEIEQSLSYKPTDIAFAKRLTNNFSQNICSGFSYFGANDMGWFHNMAIFEMIEYCDFQNSFGMIYGETSYFNQSPIFNFNQSFNSHYNYISNLAFWSGYGLLRCYPYAYLGTFQQLPFAQSEKLKKEIECINRFIWEKDNGSDAISEIAGRIGLHFELPVINYFVEGLEYIYDEYDLADYYRAFVEDFVMVWQDDYMINKLLTGISTAAQSYILWGLSSEESAPWLIRR